MSFNAYRGNKISRKFLDLQFKTHTEYPLGCLGNMNFWFAVNLVGFEKIDEFYFHTQNEFILINCTAGQREIRS